MAFSSITTTAREAVIYIHIYPVSSIYIVIVGIL